MNVPMHGISQPQRGMRIPAQGTTLGREYRLYSRSEGTPHIPVFPIHTECMRPIPGFHPGLVCIAPLRLGAAPRPGYE